MFNLKFYDMKKIILIFSLIVLPLSSAITENPLKMNGDMIDYYCLHMKKIHQEKIKMNLIKSISFIESSNNPLAHNKSEDAVGLLQIRKVMVDDVNRILGYKKFSYEDRWDVEKSTQIFFAYQNHYNKDMDLETAARIWNGGPKGAGKKATDKYWKKVKRMLNKN